MANITIENITISPNHENLEKELGTQETSNVIGGAECKCEKITVVDSQTGEKYQATLCTGDCKCS